MQPIVRKWTVEESEILRQMIKDDKTALLIAARLKRNVAAIRRHAARCGMSVKGGRKVSRSGIDTTGEHKASDRAANTITRNLC